MSAISRLIKQTVRVAMRPIKAPLKALLRHLVRRVSTKFADDIVPLDELVKKVGELAGRQDRQEGFHWDHAALARRLAAIEDRLESLQRRQCGGEDHPHHDEPADARPVIRLIAPDIDHMAPTVLERTYRWEKTG